MLTLRERINPSSCPTVCLFAFFFFPVSSSSLAVVNGFADMLPGLQQGQEKMSKSDPSSAIFMEDEEVN